MISSTAIVAKIGRQRQKWGTLLGSRTGTTNAQLAEELFGRDRVRLYDTFGAAMLALVNGDVDGVVIDNTAAAAFVSSMPGRWLSPLPEFLGMTRSVLFAATGR